jgi:hypothetical protein
MSHKRSRKTKGPFVILPFAILNAPAWRVMEPTARLLWIALRCKLRNDGLNNGKIWVSCRDGAKAIGVNRKTIGYRFAELEHYGFLRKTSEGFLGVEGHGNAPHWRFTDLPHGTHPPTQEFAKWDGELFVYTPHRAGRKKQNPVPVNGTPRPNERDIKTANGKGSLCPNERDINESSRCPSERDISRLPLPPARKAQIRGSSTARASVKAEGAGSSPAPVASDERGRSGGLMSYVADVIRQELDRHERVRLVRCLGHGRAASCCENAPSA